MRLVLFILTTLWLSGPAAFAQRTISGLVSDPEGEPLIGANVVVRGTTIGTVTDIDGTYTLEVPDNTTVLLFSYTGYATQEVEIGASNTIDVTLQEGVTLQEAVVTALGIEREEKALGYSIQSVENEEFTRGGERSVLNGLQGKVAGVNIQSASGSPGSSTRIVIRGLSSLSQSSNPLIVVDGVPLSNAFAGAPTEGARGQQSLDRGYDFGNQLNTINPEDIANITVLKGASATALYGNRAANGVIVITTKKGQDSQNQIGISYSGSVTGSRPLRLPNYQSMFGQGWDAQHFLDENGSWGPAFDGQLRLWGRVVDNTQLLKPYVAAEDNLRNFFDTGVSNQHSISLSGGNEQTTFYGSFSFLNDNGVYPTDADEFTRYTFALRGTHQVGNLQMSASLNYVDGNNSFVPTGQDLTVIDNLMQIPTDFVITEMYNYQDKFFNINEYYTPFGVGNPYFNLNEDGNLFNSSQYFGNFMVAYTFADWLTARYRLGGDVSSGETSLWRSILRPEPGTPNAASSVNEPGFVEEGRINNRQFNHTFLLEANRPLSENLDISATLGFDANERHVRSVTNFITAIDVPGFFNLSNSSTLPNVVQGESLRRIFGVLGQVTLDYRDFLYLNLSARNDWSSTLPQENRSFFYPGANLSIVLSELMGETNLLSFAKLRLGWGRTGNDAPPYSIDPVFVQSSITRRFVPFTFPINATNTNAFEVGNTIGNPSLRPEFTTEFEIGADLRFFRGRVGLDITYYNRQTTDLITQIPFDPSTGFTNQFTNLGRIDNIGIEALLNIGLLRSTNGFNWNLSTNFTRNDNTVVELTEELDKVALGGLSTTAYVAIEGQPLGVLEGPVPRRDPEGNIIVDANGIPIQAADKEIYGTTQPDFILGLTNQFGYRGLNLSVTFDWRQGGLMYSRTSSISQFTGNSVITTYNERKPFIVPNSVQEVDNGDGTFSYVENTIPVDKEHMDDYYRAPALDRDDVINRSFIKLREVALSYSLPRSWFNNLPVRNIQLSLIGRNLALWTPDNNQFIDPESTTNVDNVGIEADFGEFSANPSVRTFGVRLQADF